MNKLTKLLSAISLALAAVGAQAGPVLIVNGSLGTSEPGTTSSITNNLSTLHTAVGNVVTVVSDIPVSLAGYAQVWDIRFSNNFALSAAQQTLYKGFLQGGGGMFLMGENSSFAQRNGSIFDFVSQVGGGTLGPNLSGSCDGLQTVKAPFTGPNPVASINWNCSGVLASKGSGDWITERASGGGSGIAWGVGDMSDAALGALTMILDVNFMQGNQGDDAQNLTKNLIGFIGNQVDPPSDVPEPETLALLGIGLIGIGAIRRRRNAQV